MVYKDTNSKCIIDQLPAQRDWMDRTFEKHAYHCFPMTLANRLGWGISFSEDVSFIWDGNDDSSDSHVKILSGEATGASPRRGNATISFETGLHISPNENISILTMPPPNIFIDGVQCITTLISSSALLGPLPIALMINKKNEVITIPAKTPIASIIPISLKYINSMELIISENSVPRENGWEERVSKRGAESMKLNSSGEWTNFYRDAVDADGEKMGEHEVKKILMKVNYE